MNGSYFVRDYLSSDYETIVFLWESLGLGNAQRGDNKDIISKTLSLGGRLLVLYNSTNEIVGTSWLTMDGRRTYIHHFGIAASLQGQGLANILLEKSMEVAKSIGLQVKLEVHKENQIALSMYKKAGFVYLGDYDVYIIRDISCI